MPGFCKVRAEQANTFRNNHLNNFLNHLIWPLRPILTCDRIFSQQKSFFPVLQVAQEEGNVMQGDWRRSENRVHPVHNLKTDFTFCYLTHTAIDGINYQLSSLKIKPFNPLLFHFKGFSLKMI